MYHCIRVKTAPTREVSENLNLKIGSAFRKRELKRLPLIEVARAARHRKGVGSGRQVAVKRRSRVWLGARVASFTKVIGAH